MQLDEKYFSLYFQPNILKLILNRLNLNYFKEELILFIAFALPLNKAIIPLLIVLLILVWILEGNFKLKTKNYKSIFFFGSIFLYLTHLFGMLYTQNIKSGNFDLEQKLSLLIFPLIFFGDFFYDESYLKRVFRSFVVGCLFGCLLCFINASIHYYFSNSVDSYFYVQFSCIMHPSYYSLYLAFAACIVLFDNTVLRKTFYKIPITLFFLLCIILLSSKGGFISIFIVFILKFIHVLFVKKKYLKSIITLLIFVVTIAIVIFGFPKSVQRIRDMFNTFKSKETALNTTSTRLVIWKHSFMIIKNKPILGVGTGDANDELLKTYVGKNEIELKERKFNAHNQFLQTSISLGILGLLALILPFIILFYKSIINQSLINLSFVILVLTNFLFEAMLETQAGVIFISFFLFLGLNYYYRQNENHI